MLSPPTDAVLAPMKRKADEDFCDSSEQEDKRVKIEDLASDDDKAIEEARTQREIITILKEKLKILAEREHALLDIHGRDPQRDVYAFELRALLRQKAVGRWTCPAFDCNQSYTRKSHMKGHIMTSIDAKHRILKSILSEIRCCYCGDEARDLMIIAQQQNREHFEDGEALQIKEMEQRRQKSCGPERTDSHFIQGNHDIQTPIPNAALGEKLSSTRLCRQDAHISRIVEHLSASRSSSSEAEDSVEVTPNAQQERLPASPFEGSQTPARGIYPGSLSVGIEENVRVNERGTTSVAAPIVGSSAVAKPYVGEDSSIDITRPESRLVSSYRIRDYTRDGTTRANVARSGCHDWHSMPHLSYEASEPHANWNASSPRSSAIPPLALMYNGVNMGHSKGDFQISQCLDQPPPIPGHSCFTASEYYDSSSYTSSEHLTRNTFMEGMGTYPGYFVRQSNAFDQSPISQEVYLKESSSEGHESYSQSGVEETPIVSRTQDE